MQQLSPLRYPGGKSRVANFIRLIVVLNDLEHGEYVEPYAGGAGVALSLLFSGSVARIRINDGDPAIAAFWTSVLEQPEALCRFVADVPLSVLEWQRQRSIYQDEEAGPLSLACATFYLNRTNRSGIIKSGGLIGGLDQSGKWKMDARFNRSNLIKRIRRIAERADQIEVSCLDALKFLATLPPGRRLCYLDPPYFRKASELYANFYRPDDHAAVAAFVRSMECPWVVSYDNAEEIRQLYDGFEDIRYDLRYTARKRYEGKEIMFFSPGLMRPQIEIDSAQDVDADGDGAPPTKAPPQITRRDVEFAMAQRGAPALPL